MHVVNDLIDNNACSPLDDGQATSLADTVGKDLLQALDWMTFTPRVVVNMGCGEGVFTRRLSARYPDAMVIGVDGADMGKLPLQDQSVDLIFANFMLPWYPDTISLLREWRRLLRPEGLLMFSALGPDTLAAFSELFTIAPQCVDMHHLGDLVLKEFADPVLETHHYTLVYTDAMQLIDDLTATSMIASSFDFDPKKHVENNEAIFEVIYAHAFGKVVQDASSAVSGEVHIPLSTLREQLRSR